MQAQARFEALYTEILNEAHKRTLRYLDEFVKLKCAPDLLALGLYPNAKEIQESMAAFSAVRGHLGEARLADPRVAVVAVGDGRTPRTGALFAFRSRWRVWSVDPAIRPPAMPVARLTCVAKPVEQWRLPYDWTDPTMTGQPRWPLAVIVAVHSHARLEDAYRAVAPAADVVHVLAMPCCKRQELPVSPRWTMTDKSVGSPKREMTYWELPGVDREG